MSLPAGRLRHWLTFEVQAFEKDSDGADVSTWVPAFSMSPRMPCDVQPLSGRELIAAQAVQSRVSVRIRTRYRPGFDAVQRARSPGGTIYNIEAVIHDPDSGVNSVTLMCSAGVNEGG